ncbi:MAG: hypothetical protein J1E36_08660, partial [Eubacterium sp.]|nr:hypothetical protein [Eubacterium sp.]
MKTKFSKRLLSILLAVMMLVTSLPFVSITAYAVTTDLKNAMEMLDTLLSADGAAYANVEPAYNAYVDAQKALDAYTYGGATTNVLTTATNKLNAAISAMDHFEGYTGTAIPTFPTSTTNDMAEYEGVGFSNVLYA